MRKTAFIAMLVSALFSASLAADWNGTYYRKNSNIQYDVTKVVLTQLDNKPTSPIVLDIGSGDGRVTNELILKHLNPKSVLGIDPSANMLKTANQTYKDVSNLKFAEGNFQGLNELEKYDVVTTFFSLHWVPKEEQALSVANMAKALKKGGFLIAAHVVKPQNTSIRVALRHCAKSKKWASYFPNYKEPIFEADPFELQKLLTDNHMRLLRFVAFEYTTAFRNDNELYDWLNGWSPFKEALGKQHRAFWMDVIKEYRLETQQLNNGALIVFKDPFIEIVAQKM